MTRLGIISNLGAGRNRTRPERIRELTGAAGGQCIEVRDLDSIREATRTLTDRDVDLLAVNGGDGTAQAVMTELVHRGEPLPDLAIVPGGTTNMSANDLNDSRPLEDALRSLAVQAARPRAQRDHVRRPLIRVDAPAIDVQYGLFLGTGLILRGMRHFRENVGSRGLRGELAAGISLVRGLAGVARGRGAWNASKAVTVYMDEEPDPWQEQIMVVATTLERLLLGLKPWWGAQSSPIHVTAMRRSPERLLRTIPALMKGRPGSRLSADAGYRSRNVAAFSFKAEDGFALDGQVFEPPPDASIAVSATAPIDFVRL